VAKKASLSPLWEVMSVKLRELIRAVRACKTAQEERAVIAKECALIRTAFKDNAIAVRHRNVAKLLFIHMLGYPSHFGQMECLKLIASPNFPEKRIGYLALMLLLDERTEVLTLVTNSLKNDLQHESQYVVGLALTSVGNLATADMGRVLVADVASQLQSSNPYVRKKAALALIRILKRIPELSEDYVDGIIGLLKDRSHGVLIAAVQLILEIVSLQSMAIERIKRIVPSLVKMLRNLLNLGYSSEHASVGLLFLHPTCRPEHDVAGIADPFLQA
jgi:AP-1 complex subunit gamma-1